MTEPTLTLDQTYVAHTYARAPVVFTHGKGSLLWDDTGKEYIDLGSGIGVNIFGLCDPEWTQAVTDQLSSLSHISNLYYTSPQAKLAQLLCEKTGMKKVFYGNSGAEANECAIKAARKYSFDHYGKGRSKIVTLKNSFHGRTMATLSATGQDSMHNYFFPFLEGFSYAEANNTDETLSHLTSDCAAVMLEMIQGEGGMKVLDKKYVQAVAAACKEKGILLIVDEVQTGNGRTGALYSYQNFEIAPDIVTTAKGLGGGLPIGAALFSEKTAGVLAEGTHGSTFGGNPVCAAGGISILSRLTQPLYEQVMKKGTFIMEQLSSAPGIEQVSGIGLMIGAKPKKEAKDVVAKCREQGVILLTAKDRLRILPALNIPDSLLEKAVSVIKAAVL